MKHKRIVANALMSIAQVIVSALVFFFLYKFLIQTLGPAKVGIWSLILASTSASQIANLGLSGSVVKFVAKYLARDEPETVSKLLQTTFLTVAVLMAGILLLFYPISMYIIGFLIEAPLLPEATPLIPMALVSVWLMALSVISNGGLDGLQKIDTRSALQMVGNIFYAALCFVLVKQYGLIGIAYANIIQYVVVLLVSYSLLRRAVQLPLIPHQWDASLFKEMLSYGVNVQVTNIATMLFDPITKALLSHFGSLSLVGFYEMANKLVTQLRSLIVAANAVLVPVVANLNEKEPERINKLYIDSFRAIFFLSVPAYSLLIVSVPFISQIWIGHYEAEFVQCALFLSVLWFFNTLTVPAYFIYQGIGDLRWNTLSHILIAVLNLILGIVFGKVWGGTGILTSWFLAASLGSLVSPFAYHIYHRYPFTKLWTFHDIILFFSAVTALALCGAINIIYSGHTIMWLFIVNGALLIVFLAIPLWTHPMRSRLISYILR